MVEQFEVGDLVRFDTITSAVESLHKWHGVRAIVEKVKLTTKESSISCGQNDPKHPLIRVRYLDRYPGVRSNDEDGSSQWSDIHPTWLTKLSKFREDNNGV